MKMNHGVTKQIAQQSNVAIVWFLTMWKLHPKFGVIVNKVQLKSSSSVIWLEYQILVVPGIPNWQIKKDLIYIKINVLSKALLIGPNFQFCLVAILF